MKLSPEISKDVFNQINLEVEKLSGLSKRIYKTKEAVGLFSRKPY